MSFLEQKNEGNRAGVDSLMSEDEDIPETGGLKRRVTKEQKLQLKKEKLLDTATDLLKTDDLPKYTPNPFGVYIGKKIEEIADTTQRDIAEKLICEIIFLAKTNNLTINTKIEGTRNQVSSFPSYTQHQIHNNPSSIHSTIQPHQISMSTISSDIQPHIPFSQTQSSLQISSHHHQISDSATSPDIQPHTPETGEKSHKQRRLQVSSHHHEISDPATLNTQYQIHNNPASPTYLVIQPHQISVSTNSSDIQPHTHFSQTQRSLQISSHHNQISDSGTLPDIQSHTPFSHKHRPLQVSSHHHKIPDPATSNTQYQIHHNPSSPTLLVVQSHQISDSATTSGIQSHTPFSHTQRRLQFSSPHHQISDPATSIDIQPHTPSFHTQPVPAFHTYPESSNDVEHAVLYGEGSNGELLKEMLVFKKN